MPILNYTSEVAPQKTAGEIQRILASKGARQISVDYDENGLPVAVEFMILLHEQPVYFRLPCNVAGVLKAMTCYGSKVPPRYQNEEQARRVAWRIIKDWVEAQLAIIESNQATMAEVFLPYVIDEGRQTLFQRFEESKRKLLANGDAPPAA